MRSGRSTSSPTARIVVAVVVLLAVALGVFLTRSGGSGVLPGVGGQGGPGGGLGTEVPAKEGSTLVEAPQIEGKKQVVLLMDGWSVRTLQGSRLTYTAATGPQDPDTVKAEPLKFLPVTASDVGAIAEGAPDILTIAAARLVTVDPSLACSADGCRTGDGELDLSFLVDTKSVPGYGKSYEAYRVGAGLQKAVLQVPADATVLNLQTEGYEPITISIGSGELAEGDAAETAEQGAAEGYGKQWHFLGAGLGKFFYPNPGWVGAEPAGEATARFQRPALRGEHPSEEAVAALVESGPLFSKGLATPVPGIAGLTDQQMTYLTSPSVGCGPGVVCVPGKVETKVEGEKVDVVNVCSTSEDFPGKATMVIRTGLWKLTYPSPTHQFGAWDGKLAGELGEGGGNGFFTGTPPLVEGPQDLKVSEIEILTGTEPQVWNHLGYLAQQDKDPEERFKTYDASSVTEVQGGMFERC